MSSAVSTCACRVSNRALQLSGTGRDTGPRVLDDEYFRGVGIRALPDTIGRRRGEHYEKK